VKRLMMIIIILMAGMAGCGTTDENGSEPTKNGTDRGDGEDISVQKGIVAGEMEPSLTKQDADSQNVYIYTVKNQTEQEKTFEFSSGQTIDFELRNAKGEVVYKDSKNKMYTQAIQEITVKQGEEFSQKIVLPTLESGSYTLTVWMTAKGDQTYKATTDVQIQ
jgi:Intracellular proteinase inhibitor